MSSLLYKNRPLTFIGKTSEQKLASPALHLTSAPVSLYWQNDRFCLLFYQQSSRIVSP